MRNLIKTKKRDLSSLVVEPCLVILHVRKLHLGTGRKCPFQLRD